MARHPVASIAQRVTLYFARNHEEEMTTVDITIKFDVPLAQVHKSLTPLIRDGMLERVSIGSGRGRMAVYSAGPELLKLIGEARPATTALAPCANMAAA